MGRRQIPVTAKQRAWLADAWNRGVALKDIARHVGRSHAWVSTTAMRMGLASRHRPKHPPPPPDRRCDCGGIVRAGVPHRCPYAEAAA